MGGEGRGGGECWKGLSENFDLCKPSLNCDFIYQHRTSFQNFALLSASQSTNLTLSLSKKKKFEMNFQQATVQSLAEKKARTCSIWSSTPPPLLPPSLTYEHLSLTLFTVNRAIRLADEMLIWSFFGWLQQHHTGIFPLLTLYIYKETLDGWE